MEISKSSLGAQIYSSFVENGHINPRKFHIDNLQIGHIWKGWKKEPALEKKHKNQFWVSMLFVFCGSICNLSWGILRCLLLLTIGDDEFLGSASDESHSDDDIMRVIFNGHLATWPFGDTCENMTIGHWQNTSWSFGIDENELRMNLQTVLLLEIVETVQKS